MDNNILDTTKNFVNKKNSNLKSIYGEFKSISEKLKNAKVSPEFWKIERENIRKANEQARKEKESMKMTFEKYHQEFTI